MWTEPRISAIRRCLGCCCWQWVTSLWKRRGAPIATRPWCASSSSPLPVGYGKGGPTDGLATTHISIAVAKLQQRRRYTPLDGCGEVVQCCAIFGKQKPKDGPRLVVAHIRSRLLLLWHLVVPARSIRDDKSFWYSFQSASTISGSQPQILDQHGSIVSSTGKRAAGRFHTHVSRQRILQLPLPQHCWLQETHVAKTVASCVTHSRFVQTNTTGCNCAGLYVFLLTDRGI